MLRGIIFIVVALSVLVFIRLVLLSIRAQPSAKAASGSSREGTVVHMPLELRSFRFDEFSVEAGPPNPASFYTTLLAEISTRNGRSNWIRVPIGTPAGLAERMAHDHDAYRYERGALIVERYDRELIASALREHINQLESQ
jgi:hypothetical protein